MKTSQSIWVRVSAVAVAASLAFAGILVGVAGSASAVPTSETLFGQAAPKVAAVTNDRAAVELGTRIVFKTPGTVTGVRFYKGKGNTGTHTGSLWASGSKPLATATFTGESDSGWQSVTFAQPVAVKAGQTYIVSYHDPLGSYADDTGYFSKPVTSGDLTAPKNAGVYTYGVQSSRPTGTWERSNYWVDVVFVPGSTIPPPPTTTAPPVTTTPVTTTPVTTTPPTTTTTEPPSNDFPTTATTGATGELADVTPPTGELILDGDNQVLENVRVHGTVTVTGCNVTVRNVEIDDGETYTGDSTPDDFLLWDKAGEGCTTTIDRVSTLTPAGKYATEAVRSTGLGHQEVTSLRAVGQQLGITLGDADHVSDSYIELAHVLRGDHNEDILEDGDNGVVLEHNTFLNPNDQTASLSLFNEFGPNTNFLIKDNLLAGGGYACYCGDGVDAHASNISFVGNVFWRRYFSDVGNWAPGRAYRADGGGQWTDNVYMNADGTITTELVPQPPVDK